MSEHFDIVVVGSGVVGASTAFHLNKLGDVRVALLDRSQVCTGGTARSCAIVRSHYSVLSNTQLTVKSLEIFTNFGDTLEDAEADCAFVNSGYLILGDDGDGDDSVAANLDAQAGVGAETFPIDKARALELHPLLQLDDVSVVGYEPQSGYADPYLTTTGFANAARKQGVTVKTDCPVIGLIIEGGAVKGVKTADGEIRADTVITAIGPWTSLIARETGIDLPLEVSRHIVLTLRSPEPYGKALPIVKDMTVENKMYFRPASGGLVLVGTGDHGDPVSGPDDMDENIDTDFLILQGGHMGARMPSFIDAEVADSWIGAYDITPDWNPVLGPVPGMDGLHIAYGFSGHGFKLAPAIGRCLAQTILGQTADVSLEPYRLSRFAEGELLVGAYGIGSIS
jgi:sarcosine oxidase, subunit beta